MEALASKKVYALKSNFTPELGGGVFANVFTIPAYGAFVGEVD
jgi:hypothetical protein